jgi:membrane-bound lytic murein transglycosylase B
VITDAKSFYFFDIDNHCFLRQLCCFITLLLTMALPLQAAALDAEQENREISGAETFNECIANIQQIAIAKGISPLLAVKTLAKVSFLPDIIESDRRQPEFTVTFGEYLGRRVTDERIEQGRQLLNEHRDLLNRLVDIYGVPPQYLIAFWGLETNYGNYLGSIPTLDALATLACDQRRSSFFTTELLNAIRLLEKPGVREPLFGSWAGAMGHTQFMPSAYLQYAVDGDGDGEVDLWTSVADALTSAANFLHHLGWKRGFRWGREVRLPEDFSFDQLGLENKLSFEQWQKAGIKTAENTPLPAIPSGTQLQAALLLPSGYQGPAFLVYDNFEVIMRWNRSELYAIAVGHLADRINGAGGLIQQPPGNQPRLSINQVKEMQSRLLALGFDPGTPDGILGPATRQAIRAFQISTALKPDGYPSEQVFAGLKMTVLNR